MLVCAYACAKYVYEGCVCVWVTVTTVISDMVKAEITEAEVMGLTIYCGVRGLLCADKAGKVWGRGEARAGAGERAMAG